jgi:hypothetical protein
MVLFIETKQEAYTNTMKGIEKLWIDEGAPPELIKQMKRCVVLCNCTFQFLLQKDEANYRSFKTKALEQWVDTLDVSYHDDTLLGMAEWSKSFYGICRNQEAHFFPNVSF